MKWISSEALAPTWVSEWGWRNGRKESERAVLLINGVVNCVPTGRTVWSVIECQLGRLFGKAGSQWGKAKGHHNYAIDWTWQIGSPVTRFQWLSAYTAQHRTPNSREGEREEEGKRGQDSCKKKKANQGEATRQDTSSKQKHGREEMTPSKWWG